MRLLLAALMTSLLATSALADPQLKNEIKREAYRITDAVDFTRADEPTLREVLRLLERANAKLDDRPDDLGLFCEPRSSSYSYVTRARDGQRLGTTDVTNAKCEEIVSKARNGLVCGPRSSSYAYIIDIATGEKRGTTDVTFSKCYELIDASTDQLICGPRSSSYSYVTRLNDGFQFGTDVTHSKCQEIINNATDTLVCAPRSSSYAYITRIATGQRIGSDITFSACFERIRSE